MVNLKLLKLKNKTRRFADFGLGLPTWTHFKKEVGLNNRLRGDVLLLRSKRDRFKLQKQKPNYLFSKFLTPAINEDFFKNSGPFKLNLQKRFTVLASYPQEAGRQIRFLKALGNRRGYRHKVFLPTRGQKTKTNAKTRKKSRKGNNFIFMNKKKIKNQKKIKKNKK